MNTFAKMVNIEVERNYGWIRGSQKEPDYTQYNEKDALHLYFKYKFGIRYYYHEKILKYINKHTDENGEVPYKKIYKKYGADKDTVDKIINTVNNFYSIYYSEDDENIDYAINNITSPDDDISKNITSSIVNSILDNVKSDPSTLQNMLTKLSENAVSSDDLSKKMILDMVINNPSLYDQFRTIIEQYSSQLITPIQTNINPTQQNTGSNLQMNDIATAIINDPVLNEGASTNNTTPPIADDGSYSMSSVPNGTTTIEPEPSETENENNTPASSEPEAAEEKTDETKPEDNSNNTSTTKTTKGGKGGKK